MEPDMKSPVRILIALLVACAAIGILALKPEKTNPSPPRTSALTTASGMPLPRLVDLGAGKCIPCKAMKPILDDLMANHAHQFSTTFIDVWENPETGKAHGVRMIPTQIFYDADGNELRRHEGFMSKEEILAAWAELGYRFTADAEDA